ncbi:MAG: DUF4184 family protein [Ginsengibacter sp.]
MPFTFSHPAIVLPATYLPKKWSSLSGLIMGSMTPDFEYFIRMRGFSRYSHTWTGLFWFDIPLALALLFIFHNVVRNTLIEHLPFSLNVRLSVFEKFNWNTYFQENIIVVFISLIIGITSHFVWDGFTHTNGYFVEAIPLLHGHVDILNYNIGVPNILQYGCSVIGGLVMLIAVYKLPEGKNTKQNTILKFWILVSAITISVFNVRVIGGQMFHQRIKPEDIIVTIISGGLIGITLLSLVLKESKRQKLYSYLEKIRNR